MLWKRQNHINLSEFLRTFLLQKVSSPLKKEDEILSAPIITSISISCTSQEKEVIEDWARSNKINLNRLVRAYLNESILTNPAS